MGLGQALAAGMGAYQAEDTRLKNKELADKKETRLQQTFEDESATRNSNAKIAKAKLADYSSPDAKRLRALKIKNEISQQSGQAQIYKEMEQDTANTAVDAKVAQKTREIEQKVGDIEAKNVSYTTYNNIYTDLATTGKIQSLDGINNFIASEPMFQNKIKGKLIKYNPIDKDMSTKLEALARQQANMNGGEPEDYFPSLEQMAKNNIIVFDSVTGDPVDIVGIGSMVGASKAIPKSLVDKANSNIVSSSQQAAESYKSSVNPASSTSPGSVGATRGGAVAGVTDIAPWHIKPSKETSPQLWKGKNPATEASRYQAYGMGVPDEMKGMIKFNAELAKGGGVGYWSGASREEVIDGVDNIMNTIENGGAVTNKMVTRAKTGINSFETADMKNQYTKQLDASLDNNRISTIYKDGANKQDHNFMRNVETQHINNAGSKSVISKKRDQVRENSGIIKDINGALELLRGMDGEVLSGYMADVIREGAAKDPGFIDSLAKLKTGDDSKVTIKEADRLRKKVLNSININTKIGDILARYIKSISGAAVSDSEREFLTGIMSGAINANPKAMATAMQSFRDSMSGRIDRDANDFHWQSMLPETMYEMRTIAENSKIDYATDMPEGTAESRDIVDALGDKATFGDEQGTISKMWEGFTSIFTSREEQRAKQDKETKGWMNKIGITSEETTKKPYTMSAEKKARLKSYLD